MTDPTPEHPAEGGGHAARLNWLRAGVLGANDGIVSVAGLVIGVAGATRDPGAILTAAVAGIVAGALSMGVGEYVSVSTQRDTEKALIAKETWELEHLPEQELDELTKIYEGKGLTPALAREVAVQLTEHDALAAHAEAELGIDHEEFTNPWAAAVASMIAFTLGAAIPAATILLAPEASKVISTVIAVVVALAITGWVSAALGGANRLRALVRNVAGGLLAMGITYWIGRLVGHGL